MNDTTQVCITRLNLTLDATNFFQLIPWIFHCHWSCQIRKVIHINLLDFCIEKRFHPITYNPVKSSYIENVSIKVANELLQPVFINDSKTVVIIHFRKRKWKDETSSNKNTILKYKKLLKYM